MLLTPVRKISAATVLPSTVVGYMGNLLLSFYLGKFVHVHILARQQQPRVSKDLRSSAGEWILIDSQY